MSDEQPALEDAPSEPLQRIGELLRQEREARGQSLEDVANAIKLLSRQVEAIEMERFDLLPGPLFVRGFVRNYARHLGLDADAVVLAMGLASPQLAEIDVALVRSAEVVMPSRRQGPGSQKSLIMVFLVVVLFLLGVAAWRLDWFGDADTKQAVGMTTTVADSPSLEGTLLPLPVVPMEEGNGHSDAPETDELVLDEPSLLVADEMPDNAIEATKPPVTGVAAGENALHFVLAEESWIQVKDKNGTVLHQKRSVGGSEFTLKGEAPLALVVGNAEKVTLTFNGAAVDLASHIHGGVARLTVE